MIDRRTFLFGGVAAAIGQPSTRLETLTDWLNASRDSAAARAAAERSIAFARWSPSIQAWVQVPPQPPTGRAARRDPLRRERHHRDARACRPSTARRFTKAASAPATPRSCASSVSAAAVLLGKTHTTAFATARRRRRAIRATSTTRLAAAPADRRPPSPPAWCRSRSARRRGDRCCGRRRSAASPDSRRATVCCPWKACCRSRRASTRSGSSRTRPPTCWRCGRRSAIRPASRRTFRSRPSIRCPKSSRRWRRRFSSAVATAAARRCRDPIGRHRRHAARLIDAARTVKFYEGARFHEQRYKEYGARLAGHGRPRSRGAADSRRALRRGAAVNRGRQGARRRDLQGDAGDPRSGGDWPGAARPRLDRRFAHELAVDRARHAGDLDPDAGRRGGCRSACS